MTKIQSISTILLSAAVSLMVCLMCYCFLPSKTIVIEDKSDIEYKQLLTKNNELLAQKSQSLGVNHFIASSKKSKAAVGHIKVLHQKSGNALRSDYVASNGSGVVLSPEGHIITNYHVIANADQIKVTLDDKREFEAQVIGYDESTDLAVLKIEAERLKFIEIANSDHVEIGEWVLAIGNPFNLESTVTAGIISAKARNINAFQKNDIEAFIQTDAAVNPGNSGGALVNSTGRLVGINTAILTSSGNYEGFSFAIPSNIVTKVYKDIISYGSVQRAWLGVSVEDLSDSHRKILQLPTNDGVKINLVERNSAAYQAGLKRNDVIISMNHKSINDAPTFLSEIAMYRPGDVIELELIRAGHKVNKTATLLNHLQTTDFLSVKKDGVLKELGLEIRNLSSIEQSRMTENGLKVISVMIGSKADDANIEADYIITSINGKKVQDVVKAVAIIEANQENGIEFEGYYEQYPGRYPYFIEVN